MGEEIISSNTRIINDKECYVAFIDILGFKSLMEDAQSYEKIKEVFQDLLSAREILWDRTGDDGKYNSFSEASNKAYMRIMSDSIVIAVPKIVSKALSFVCRTAGYMQLSLLDKGILARGGIAEGSFYGNGEVSFGSGLTNAYNIENTIAIYPRVVIQPSVVKELATTVNVIRYSKDDYYYVDYISSKVRIGRKDIFKKFIEENIIKYELSPNVRKKYLWLREEYNNCITKLLEAKKENISEDDYIIK